MKDFTVSGKVISITEEAFTSSKNIPYIKVVLKIEYECDIYSWKKGEWFKFPKQLIFEHLLTKFTVDRDPLYEELYIFSFDNGNKTTYVDVGFWVSSEERQITTTSGYEMTIVDQKLKINTIKKTSPIAGEYGDIKDTEQDFLDTITPGGGDDVPF